MNKSMSDLVDQAEALLGISISYTNGGRPAYYARESRSWYLLTRADLAYAAACPDADRYSHWCAGAGREIATNRLRGLGLADER